MNFLRLYDSLYVKFGDVADVDATCVFTVKDMTGEVFDTSIKASINNSWIALLVDDVGDVDVTSEITAEDMVNKIAEAASAVSKNICY